MSEDTRYYPDDGATRFASWFFQSDCGHLAMLHAAGRKAGFIVNGRRTANPWTYSGVPEREERRP